MNAIVDIQRTNALSASATEPASGISRAVSCGSRGAAWHCAWTHPRQERRAADAITAVGFQTYYPLTIERDKHGHTSIGPLFPRYVFARFDAQLDPWGCIANCRGVGGLIRHGIDSPTQVPDEAIAELIARTSTRGIVDDPGAAPQEPPHGVKAIWQGITALDAASRSRLLVRLFGRGCHD